MQHVNHVSTTTHQRHYYILLFLNIVCVKFIYSRIGHTRRYLDDNVTIGLNSLPNLNYQSKILVKKNSSEGPRNIADHLGLFHHARHFILEYEKIDSKIRGKLILCRKYTSEHHIITFCNSDECVTVV